METATNEALSNQRAAIEVSGLTKRFEKVQALAGVDFTVAPGEFFGLLGPNGAGKTTTIRILTGLSRPDAGTIRIGGIDCTTNPKAAQHVLGVVPDESNLYPELTGFENLCFCGSLYGMRKREREARAEKLLQTFGLKEAGHRKFGGYSKGMKRKPTTGIDVASARQIRQLIADLHRDGTTILLTTHYIEEAERLCQRIAFIVQGRIVRVDALAKLLEPVQGRHVLRIAASPLSEDLIGGLEAAFPDLEFSLQDGQALRVESVAPLSIGPMVRFLEEQGVTVSEARKIQPSLEDVFVETTGLEARALEQDKGKVSARGGKQ